MGHAAYDLASMTQDARVDISPELADHLFDHYCRLRAQDAGFNRSDFATAYAISGRTARDQNSRHLCPTEQARRQTSVLAAHPPCFTLSRAQSAAPGACSPQSVVHDPSSRSHWTAAIMSIGKRAMVLAAGFGSRMRPLTNTTPKPLVKVAGQPLIDYAMNRLREFQVETAVVNGHYLADQIEDWSKTVTSPEIVFSNERDAILDTGGGIARALPLLGDDPFFVLNADCFWIDGKVPALSRLASEWRDSDMDCLLLLCDVRHTTGYDGKGDFVIGERGILQRSRSAPEQKAYAYIGGYLVHPRLFAGASQGAFSMNELWDKAIAEGRLFGLAHDGHWLHVGTVAAIQEAEDVLRRR